jgi:hypothetical protein
MPPHGRLWSWKRHSPLWELSRQSHSVIQVQTWRLTLPGRTTRKCPKAVPQRKPWSWCVPNKDTAIVRPPSLRMESLLPLPRKILKNGSLVQNGTYGQPTPLPFPCLVPSPVTVLCSLLLFALSLPLIVCSRSYHNHYHHETTLPYNIIIWNLIFCF